MQSSGQQQTTNFKLALISLFLVLFIDGLGQGIIFPVLASSLLKAHSHILLQSNPNEAVRDLLYGCIIAVFFLSWFIGGPLLSDYSDSVGRKKPLAICLTGSVIGFLLTAMAFWWHSIVLIFLGRLIDGFTSGSQSIAQAAIIDICPEDKKARYIGLILLSVSLGIILGPVIGGVFSSKNIATFFNEATPMYVAMLLGTINLVILVRYFKETSKHIKATKLQLSRAIEIFVSAFRDKNVRKLSIAFIMLQVGWSMFYFYGAALMVAKFAISGFQVGLYTGLVGLGLALGFTYIVRITEAINKRYLVLAGYGLVGLATVVNILATSSIDFWLMAIPAGAGISLGYSNILAIFSQQAGEDRQGWVMGITGSMVALASGVTALSIGPLTAGTQLLPFIVSAIIQGIGLLLFARMEKRCQTPTEK